MIPFDATPDSEPTTETPQTPTAPQSVLDAILSRAGGLSRPVGSAQIPSGSTLMAVADPNRPGDDTYYLVGAYSGVGFGWRIGDYSDLLETIPDFERVVRSRVNVTRRQFEEQRILEVGTVDEVLGSTEDIGFTIQRQLRAFGMESLPDWMRSDPEAMFISATGANEGWSPGRTLRELSGLRSFRDRFPAWQTVLQEAGGDEAAAMQQYTQTETRFRDLLRSRRGPNADLSPGYVGNLIAAGWTPEAVAPILDAEQTVRADPSLLAGINRMLQASGQAPIGVAGATALVAAGNMPTEQARQVLGQVDLTRLLNGNDPGQVIDLVNDALTLTSFEEAGLTGLSLDFVRGLRDESRGVLEPEQVMQFAQEAALQVIQFLPDIELGRYGLTQEQVVSAAAGRGDAQVADTLSRIVRERQLAARGTGGFSGFVNARGRLQLQGLAGI